MNIEFNLDEYIKDVCAAANLDVDDKIFANCRQTDTLISSWTASGLLKYIMTQNWDTPKAVDDGKALHNIFLESRYEEGLVPKILLVDYLKFAKITFPVGLFVTDVFEAKYLYDKFIFTRESNSPVLIICELGSEAGKLAKIFHEDRCGSAEKLLTIECGELPDESLYAQLFDSDGGLLLNETGGKNNPDKISSIGTIFFNDLNKLGHNCKAGLSKYLYSVSRRRPAGQVMKNYPMIIATTHEKPPNLSDPLDSELIGQLSYNTVIRRPLRENPINIPLIITEHCRSIGQYELRIPWELLRFWAFINPPANNYDGLVSQLNHYIDCYNVAHKMYVEKYGTPLSAEDLSFDSGDVVKGVEYKSPDNSRLFSDVLLGILNIPGLRGYIAQREAYSLLSYDVYKDIHLPYIIVACLNSIQDEPEYIEMANYNKISATTRRHQYDRDTLQPIKSSKLDSAKELSTRRPSIPKKALDSIEPIPWPPGVDWESLKVGWSETGCTFDIQNNDEATYPTGIRTFKQMGFESQRPRNEPIMEWGKVLGALAQHNGTIDVTKKDSYLPQWVSRTNDRLRVFFKVDDNLIFHQRAGTHTYYKIKFKIYRLK